jgi:coenzyme F420-reducing hydrogenase delta subunit
MAPPSLIDYIISRNLAEGVAVAGCAESACYHRLGIAWTKQRFARQRDPYLRARVPRERIATIWTSALARTQFEIQLAEFRRQLSMLPTMRQRPASAETHPGPRVVRSAASDTVVDA